MPLLVQDGEGAWVPVSSEDLSRYVYTVTQDVAPRPIHVLVEDGVEWVVQDGRVVGRLVRCAKPIPGGEPSVYDLIQDDDLGRCGPSADYPLQ